MRTRYSLAGIAKIGRFNTRLSLAVVALIAGLVLAGAAHAAGPFRPFRLGLWAGGAYTNDNTGSFSHCAALVPYKSGITMAVAVNRSFGWTMGFYDPQWTLVQNSQIPIELHFDGGAAVDVSGTAIKSNLVVVAMPDNSRLINAFRFAYQMNAVSQGRFFLFNLTSTSKLMVQLVDCVRTSLAMESNTQPAPQQPTIAPSTSQDILLEETQLATNFLLAARLPGAQIVPQSNMPAQLASYGAVWKAEDAIGAVKIYAPQPGLKGLDLASQIIGSDAQSCKGKFASGRYSELVDADVVVRAVTWCTESEGQTEAQYFITPRPNGGFVGFAVVTKAGSEQQATSSAQKVGAFEKAALTAASMH